ncbi:hypothetical protein [Enterococcus viikkiensis]|uniref:hypothetical protein n=1 Tax=Enterococcus viikkiensis TaxID=930854 RepID=UPI003F8E9F56
MLDHGLDLIQDILQQMEDETFDYVIHSIAMPFSKQIAEYLMLPAISMLAAIKKQWMPFRNMRNKINTGPFFAALYLLF